MLDENLTGIAKSIYCDHFEAYRSNVCHLLHNLGDTKFIDVILKENVIDTLVKKQHSAWALYLLAMLDYICRENNIPLSKKYTKLRNMKLDELYIPNSIRIGIEIFNDNEILKEAYKYIRPQERYSVKRQIKVTKDYAVAAN